MRVLRTIFTLAIVAGIGIEAKAGIIVNGDFEDSSQWDAWTFDSTATSNPVLGPALLDFGIKPAQDAFGNGTPSNGVYVGGLELVPGTVRLSQTVTGLFVGGKYYLSFDLNLRDLQAGQNDSFRVLLDSNPIFLGGDPLQYSSAYVRESVSFLATSSTATISFVGQFESDVSYNLDNVSLTATPVPEPTSLAIFGIGALGMVGTRRRRKRA
ncbi:PEP-CTERM sorting domain-containing protein [Rubripirellula sp.]|nr:PEP-CTERM sorting domain-containing protein [Rubripirellula sp.]